MPQAFFVTHVIFRQETRSVRPTSHTAFSPHRLRNTAKRSFGRLFKQRPTAVSDPHQRHTAYGLYHEDENKGCKTLDFIKSFKWEITGLDNKLCFKIVHLNRNILLKVGCRVALCRNPFQFWDRAVGIIQHGGAHDSAQEYFTHKRNF